MVTRMTEKTKIGMAGKNESDELDGLYSDLEEIEKLEKKIGARRNSIRKFADFIEPEELYQELKNSIYKYHPSTDISQVEKAYKIAFEAHKGQKRRSGEAYIIHPLSVAIILAELELDKETIEAGLLHDVVEDTVMTDEEIAAEFGEEVALLVDGVTKLGRLSYDADKVEIQAENLRKMFLAMAKDIRVILIKLADRLHNMRTLKYMRPGKQKEIARETMDIYSPIAQRLGISKIKIELDDLSLKYLETEAYAQLVEQVAQRKTAQDDYIRGLTDEVRHHIECAGIQAEIGGRAKHFFSIYKKMVNQNKTIDQIYDLFAIRIIVKNVMDCYAALGVIHENYVPVPGRFKDYIAMPKPNRYQSLHTTLMGLDGQPFEIQIRTVEMHRIAEYGIAAHWKYKEAANGVKSTGNQEEEKLTWLRQILEWQQDMSDNKEFMSLLKSDLDLFSDAVFCFTPNGDVKNLPNGSTPVDFAYSVHSAVGNKMIGAKVNGKLVTIDYKIQNGDRIEIITSQNSKGPSHDWLNIVKSTQAKTKINQWFRNELKEENIIHGKELAAAYCKSKGIDISLLNKTIYQDKAIRKYGFHDWNSCLATIGHGGIKEASVVNKMYDEYCKDHPMQGADGQFLFGGAKPAAGRKKTKNGIIVKGMYGAGERYGKCCNPLPGDEICGYITRGRGITIHRTDCYNMINISESEKERIVEAEWPKGDSAEAATYIGELCVYCRNRTWLLNDISRILSERGIDIIASSSKVSKQGIASVSLSFATEGKDHLNRIIEIIRQVDGVIDIERAKG